MNNATRIQSIESNLVKFVPGDLILPETLEIFTLAERMAATKVPGVSMAVIDNFEIEWAKSYGLLKNGEDRPVTPESLFQACSVSKMVTAPLALHLAEQGVLDLDVDVNGYLRSWQIPENEFTYERKVTLRGLLSHQSGLNRPDGGFEWEEGSTPTLLQILNGEAPAQVQATHVEFLPGSKWQYSNVGYVVIQLILEDVLGKPFTQITEEILFDPLGMADSTFEYPLSPEWATREITLHNEDGNPTHPGMIPSALAHGGLMTTPSDLACFGIALMQAYRGQAPPGQVAGILSPALVQQMFEQQRWVEDLSAFGFPFGQGLGAFLVGEEENEIIFHPGGNDPGASCLLCLLPKKGQGAAIMTNGLQGLYLTLEILSAIAHEYQWVKNDTAEQ
jgi:CubicO group peptidase (beta-lactamase class C family)